VKLFNILAPFLISTGLAVARQPGNPPPAADPHSAASSMTGCLAKGSIAGEFLLAGENGRQTVLISNNDLSKHVAHKIRVTGSATKQQEKSAFNVQAVEHIADSCK